MTRDAAIRVAVEQNERAPVGTWYEPVGVGARAQASLLAPAAADVSPWYVRRCTGPEFARRRAEVAGAACTCDRDTRADGMASPGCPAHAPLRGSDVRGRHPSRGTVELPSADSGLREAGDR